MVERIGKYELHRQIGSGGMAEVWAGIQATDVGPNNICAVKLIHPHVARDPNYRALFLDEGRLAMQIRHSNLITVFDVGEHDGRLFMAMELVDGVPLDRWLQRVRSWYPDRPNLEDSLYIIRMLLWALHHVHTEKVGFVDQRVVHRDVSPQNVLVSSAGEIKLTDFGIARRMDGHHTGRIYGKLAYMPREQYQGNPVQQSDLFAVGAIFYELLTGKELRGHCRSRAEMHEAIVRNDLPELPPGLPPPVHETLAGLLEPDPARRIQSARAALELLGLHLSPCNLCLRIADLYVECVRSRHSWYTDLTKAAQIPADATTEERPRPGRSEERIDADSGVRPSPPAKEESSVRGVRGEGADDEPKNSSPPKGSKGPQPTKHRQTVTLEPANEARETNGKRADHSGSTGKRMARSAHSDAEAVSAQGSEAKEDEDRIDTEAPVRGRPWESVQGHEAACKDDVPPPQPVLDDMTTVPWGRRLDADPPEEVQP